VRPGAGAESTIEVWPAGWVVRSQAVASLEAVLENLLAVAGSGRISQDNLAVFDEELSSHRKEAHSEPSRSHEAGN
jgi:hypothetical protein